MKDIIWIALAASFMCYSAIATVIIIILYCKRFERQKAVFPDCEQVIETETISEYDTTPPLRQTPIYRTLSVPNQVRVTSIYDANTCASKPTTLHIPAKQKGEDNDSHHYEVIGEIARISQYDKILHNVATTLSNVYQDSVEQGSLYKVFLRKLMTTIRETNPSLYNSIQSMDELRHHYEKIQSQTYEKVPSIEISKDGEGDSEDDYAIFLPKGEATVEFVNKQFGSNDHLKFLVESHKQEKWYETNEYLKAKRYSARENCPEHLKRLCKSQDLHSGIKAGCNTLPRQAPSRAINETGLHTIKIPPKVPPKKGKNKSSQENIF